MAKYALILLLHSGWLHLGGHDSHNLPLHFIELNHHLTQDIIDSSFVVLIDLGNSEGCDPRQDEKSHGVEPGADVGEAPEGETKLNSVHHVLHQEQSAELSTGLAEKLNCGLGELRRLFLVDNMVDTVKFGLSLWCLTYIGSWFNAMTLLILTWITVFTVPKIYQNNKAAIDDVLGKVKVQLDEVKGKVMAVMPAQLKPAVVEKED
jgi:hypothetical protein